MSTPVRAVAVDYDNTLTVTPRPRDDVLDALAATRACGYRVILVTGRILAELRAVFPECAELVDLIVAENGAVLAAGSLALPLAAPLPLALGAALDDAGVPYRRGEVILATQVREEAHVLAALQRFAADAQLVRNRGELMVVPHGVSKASGLRCALLHLGVSPHSTVAVGDAENDLAMLELCEVGVAVGNAIDLVKARADLVLDESDGDGVLRVLHTVREGALVAPSRRWQISLGRAPDGTPVRLPASGVDIVIAGGSGSGKSFAAGLVAEELIRLGYVVCLLDAEGDHVPLGRLPNVVALGGPGRVPAPEDLAQIFEHSGTSVVVDLSLVSAAVRTRWSRDAIRYLERRRAATGVPHWLVIDEAHHALGTARGGPPIDPRLKGHCLITYRPGELDGRVCHGAEFLLLVAARDRVDISGLAPLLQPPGGRCLDELAALRPGEALLVRRGDPLQCERLRCAPRWVPHVRHWHKYSRAQMAPERRFYFRAPTGLTGAVAGNMEDLHRELRAATLDTLRQHASGGDFSRWAADVVRDQALATALRRGEACLRAAEEDEAAERARHEMLAAIERRYGAAAAWGVAPP